MVTLILPKIRKAQKHDCSIVRNDSKYVHGDDIVCKIVIYAVI